MTRRYTSVRVCLSTSRTVCRGSWRNPRSQFDSSDLCAPGVRLVAAGGGSVSDLWTYPGFGLRCVFTGERQVSGMCSFLVGPCLSECDRNLQRERPSRFAFSTQRRVQLASAKRRCARSSMDRASDYGSEGWGFESLRARSGPPRCDPPVGVLRFSGPSLSDRRSPIEPSLHEYGGWSSLRVVPVLTSPRSTAGDLGQNVGYRTTQGYRAKRVGLIWTF